jgi:tRNA pseudouridine38-40 synthase
MQNWKLTLEYDGTRYGGWQKQHNARTVQGELINATQTFLKTKVDIGGSGRTDAGVHALHQVAHLKIKDDVSLSNKQLQIGLNDLLPHDINVLKVENAHANFHARHDAVSRYYIYQISTRRTAFAKNYVWWVRDRLNLTTMKEATSLLIGRHDFHSFCEDTPTEKSTIVVIEDAKIFTSGDLILFRISASHFLWKMVRRIIGALVEVGREKISVPQFKNLLEKKSKESAAWTAPSSGLFLEKVLYKGDEPPKKLKVAFPIH